MRVRRVRNRYFLHVIPRATCCLWESVSFYGFPCFADCHINFGMIATGNHLDFDALRAAPRYRSSQ